MGHAKYKINKFTNDKKKYFPMGHAKYKINKFIP